MNGNDDMSLLSQLLDQIRSIAEDGGFELSEAVHVGRARNVLEATAGDVATAAQLYWDDFLATRQQQQAAAQQQQQEDEEESSGNEDNDQDMPDAAPAGAIADHDDDDDDADDDENRPDALRRRLFNAAVENANGAHDEEPGSDEDMAQMRNRRRRREEPTESVSVSDDEGVMRLKSRARQLGGGTEESHKRRKLLIKKEFNCEPNKKDDNDDSGDSDGGYLSDNDWLWESLITRETIPDTHPVDLLWGQDPAPVVKKTEKMEDDDDDDDSSTVPQGIPRTWLNAGFCLKSPKNEDDTTRAVGLAILPPNEDDFAYPCWKDMEGNDVPFVPPPYHCRATSAVLSIVTALLYTGAALQTGGQVSCNTSRKPFLDLISESNKRKSRKSNNKNDTEAFTREFEARLADALSALLFIAAKASADRKAKALQSLSASSDPADKRKWQKLQQKLRLVPTCWWSKENEKIKAPISDDGTTCHVQVATSYTNMEDLRSYVLGNMSSFTSAGGCALFLETIMRIHGQGAISRMIRRSRAAGSGNDTEPQLVRCTCDQRHSKALATDAVLCQTLKAAGKNRRVLDTTPEGNDCFSTELLSLILTGNVHSNLQGWSTGPLGIGILSDKPGTVGRGLTRPDKPVWILRGPTCYSVLWLNGSNDHADTFAKIDRPGCVATMTHWNCWYGHRTNETLLRLVADRSSQWKPPKQVISDDDNDDEDAIFEREIAPLSRTMQQLARRRRANQLAANEQGSIEGVDDALIVTDIEMERVKVDDQDQKFYPNKHRMWRYDMGEAPSSEDRKQHAVVYRPFFSLTDREKLVVETKFGPKISTILWTRWPRAVVDRFIPETPPAIV